jgi:hypothetical protein
MEMASWAPISENWVVIVSILVMRVICYRNRACSGIKRILLVQRSAF